MSQPPRRRLSIFSFGSSSNSSTTATTTKPLSANSPSTDADADADAPDHQYTRISPGTSISSASARKGPQRALTADGKLSVNTGAVNGPSPSAPVASSSPTSPGTDLNIFERSVQDNCSCGFESPSSRRPPLTRLRSKPHHGSSISLSNFKNEDYIPPALDATTSILSDSTTNLDNVDIIYSSRRNSSVIGLNMALGRPAPSRKNSVYSMSQLNSSPNIPQQPPIAIPELESANLSQSQSLNQPISPTSPPRLSSSKSSISFYSYADLINNDEFAKRPSFKQNLSQSMVPSRKNSAASGKAAVGPNGFKKFDTNLSRFLISPESSDSEDDIHSKRKSFHDTESLVSESIGECLRQNKTELSGSS
ncbi:putative beta-1,6-N-acetylglucosaminyltransferase [Yamadazyma tenuis]|uniref:Uncharacterized protein n=1 Tax=Candida tenuis (strain ATCC 10573 / BCRC 21748 / CBS 615 / JCM 9827 / NBRC 10315 / NRRL Y-1498 / VKM Y-70) TaxID=590646 RepID=G3BFI1_CANTC|nr:uncharacterized protein CANTEDRAFT_96142 [Yamadazyma tenuis ATCC 10573]EGV60698.1 hypothetical protein CANTEDRAFT_96142 [Yamadazyma tenuis ATCC 10573]WEJ94040.1 putative beta-1,6-N-acetylglucosaminyltransferase [Yamadazyma tenuis]